MSNDTIVIGLDLGNWFSYPCVARGIDAQTRKGGFVEPLIPSKFRSTNSEGIPSEFVYGLEKPSGKKVERYGFDAAAENIEPIENHIRLLKNNMGKSVELYTDGESDNPKKFNYDDLIVNLFQYVVRNANSALQEKYHETTNLVSLTYPSRFIEDAAVTYYTDLAERALSGSRDINGNELKIKVISALSEPAAAGLDYLADNWNEDYPRDITVAVFDLGGGTYDFSIVKLYPKGEKKRNGETYYYEPIAAPCQADIGGSKFSERLREIMEAEALKVLPVNALTRSHKKAIRRNVERCKRELSEESAKATCIELACDDSDYDIIVTKDQFENAIKPDVDKIMEITRKYTEEHRNLKFDRIIMTGGSSHISYVVKRLKQTFPDVAKIELHRPSCAAAYGAARFYDLKSVRMTLAHEIGVGLLNTKNHTVYIKQVAPQGVELPYTSELIQTLTATPVRTSKFQFYQANKDNPRHENGHEQDFDLTTVITLEHGREVPADYEHFCQVTINESGGAVFCAKSSNEENIVVKSDVVKVKVRE